MHARIRAIVIFTICYNIVEAVVALSSGALANSGALIGFGLDSTIEVSSALAVMWQFTRKDPQKWEPLTLKLIGIAFFALALFVSFDAIHALITREIPDHSTVGIIIAAASVVIMPIVSYLERQAGIAAGSASAVADSRQTLMCAYLSVAVLIGLILHATLGWWWADPVAALFIAVLALREGKEAWEGDSCALSAGRAFNGEDEDCCCCE